jgi:hypothetical protein
LSPPQIAALARTRADELRARQAGPDERAAAVAKTELNRLHRLQMRAAWRGFAIGFGLLGVLIVTLVALWVQLTLLAAEPEPAPRAAVHDNA